MVGSGCHVYLCDSRSQIRNLERLSLDDTHRSGRTRSVCVTSDDVVPAAPADHRFDHLIVLPAVPRPGEPGLLSLEHCAVAVRRLLTEEPDFGPVKAIVSCGEYTTLVAAELRAFFHVPGPGGGTARAFRDKVRMKRLAGADVRVPRYEVLREISRKNAHQQYDRVRRRLGVVFVVKPTNMSSSVGVRLVDSEASFVAATADDDLAYEAEEYVCGTQYHCEVAFDGRRPVLSLVSRFNASQLDMMAGRTVGTMPLPVDDAESIRIGKFSRRACLALGAADVVTHTEVIVRDNGEIVFVESAARTPGGDVVRRYLEVFGIDLFDLDMRLKSARPYLIPDLSPPRGQFSFWAYVPRPTGRVARLDVPALRSAIEVEWYVTVGSKLLGSANFEEPAGLVIGRGDDYDQLSRDFDAILDHPFIVAE